MLSKEYKDFNIDDVNISMQLKQYYKKYFSKDSSTRSDVISINKTILDQETLQKKIIVLKQQSEQLLLEVKQNKEEFSCKSMRIEQLSDKIADIKNIKKNMRNSKNNKAKTKSSELKEINEQLKELQSAHNDLKNTLFVLKCKTGLNAQTKIIKQIKIEEERMEQLITERKNQIQKFTEERIQDKKQIKTIYDYLCKNRQKVEFHQENLMMSLQFVYEKSRDFDESIKQSLEKDKIAKDKSLQELLYMQYNKTNLEFHRKMLKFKIQIDEQSKNVIILERKMVQCMELIVLLSKQYIVFEKEDSEKLSEFKLEKSLLRAAKNKGDSNYLSLIQKYQNHVDKFEELKKVDQTKYAVNQKSFIEVLLNSTEECNYKYLMKLQLLVQEICIEKLAKNEVDREKLIELFELMKLKNGCINFQKVHELFLYHVEEAQMKKVQEVEEAMRKHKDFIIDLKQYVNALCGKDKSFDNNSEGKKVEKIKEVDKMGEIDEMKEIEEMEEMEVIGKDYKGDPDVAFKS
ncbi:MAG: hypothetical protein AAFO15_02595 [Pseudomonadota bacterium]